MGRRCILCHHEDRAELERSYASGTSIAELARRAGCSDTAARRHLKEHALAALRDAHQHARAAAIDQISVEALLADYALAREAVIQVMAHAKRDSDHALLLRGVAALYKGVELAGKLIGLLGERDDEGLRKQIVAEVTSVMVIALQDHPDAAAAIEGVLQEAP